MRKAASILFAFLALLAIPLRAQSTTDAGDLFVNAYMDVQQGEKAEQSGNLKQALAKLRAAATVLDQISTHFPNWQPNIVDYRKQRTSEGIARLQEKLQSSGGGGASGGGTQSPAEPPPLPQPDEQKPLDLTQGPVSVDPPSAPPTTHSGSRTSKPQSTRESTLFKEAEARMQKLEKDLKNAKEETAQLLKQKNDLALQLDAQAKARADSDQKQQVLQKRADNAEQALMKASSEGKVDSEKLKGLQADVAATKKAVKEMKIDAEADAFYRHQLDDRYRVALNRIQQLTQQRDSANQASDAVPGKIEAIQQQLEEVKKEKDGLAMKLQTTEQQLSKVTSERDDALAHVAKLQDASKNIEKLLAENADLTTKLADAQKSITQFKLEGAEKDRQIASLKQEVNSVKDQLAQAKKESADFQRQMADLQIKLEDTGKQLAEAKAENTASAVDKKKMADENAILRGIVLRQQKEEAVRAKTRKAVLEQLSELEIHSKTLLKQIDYLGQPVVMLTAKERALFKKPELQISDMEISVNAPTENNVTPAAESSSGPEAPTAKTTEAPAANPAVVPTPPAPARSSAPVVEVNPTPPPVATTSSKTSNGSKVASNPSKNGAAKPADKSGASEQPPLPTPENQPSLTLAPAAPPTPPGMPPTSLANTASNKSTAPPADTSKPADSTASGTTPLVEGGNPSTGAPNGLPAELLPLAREGKDQFERANYLEAEKIYRKILAKVPNNLYTLSNLGVVLFRAGKNKLAEEEFKKAIAVAPEDGFSHCTLGIVFYQEGKYDDAVSELTKALNINPKNATAHNYLGITASQKGWLEAAQKELETATVLDPQYADAHFNLAVVFATQTPPNKENARKYYQRATELGAERDSALEQLIK